MNQKLRFLCFQGIHNSLPSFWAKLGYSQIKIDHIADSLLKLKIKIGEHLINAELSQLLTLTAIYARFAKKDDRLFATHYIFNKLYFTCKLLLTTPLVHLFVMRSHCPLQSKKSQSLWFWHVTFSVMVLSGTESWCGNLIKGQLISKRTFWWHRLDQRSNNE